MSEPAELDPGALAERLRTLRRHHRLTLHELSAQAGISQAHLSRVEKGLRRPSSEALLRLARAYGLSLGQLLGDDTGTGFEVRRATATDTFELDDGTRLRPLSGAFPTLGAFRYLIGPAWTSRRAEHAGEEWIYVLDGTLEVMVSSAGVEHTVELRTADALHIGPSRPHRLRTSGSADVLIVTADGAHPDLPHTAPA